MSDAENTNLPAQPTPPQAAQPNSTTTGTPAVPTPMSYEVQLPQNVTLSNPWKRLGAAIIDQILLMVTLVIGWLIWAAVTAGSGQTPGKKLLGMRVINQNTKVPVSVGTMLLRGIVGGLVAGLVFPLTLGVLIFMPFWDRRKQTIFEKVSGTLVVDDPLNVWGR